jgi:hypothetical protein
LLTVGNCCPEILRFGNRFKWDVGIVKICLVCDMLARARAWIE